MNTLPISQLDRFIYIYIYIYISVQMVRVFNNGPGGPWFNPRSSHTKDSKMVLDTSLH